MARRDDRAYREYVREEQRSQRGCIARRMQRDFHHGLVSSPDGTFIAFASNRDGPFDIWMTPGGKRTLHQPHDRQVGACEIVISDLFTSAFEEQRSRRGCIARRLQPDFRHGLLNVPVTL